MINTKPHIACIAKNTVNIIGPVPKGLWNSPYFGSKVSSPLVQYALNSSTMITINATKNTKNKGIYNKVSRRSLINFVVYFKNIPWIFKLFLFLKNVIPIIIIKKIKIQPTIILNIVS